MLVMTDAIRNRVARNRERGIRTHVIMDEMHIFFANELSSQFFSESWKQFRKDGALATGITQNVEDCLKSVTARTMLANSEYLVMLNQAPTDRAELAKLLNMPSSRTTQQNGAFPEAYEHHDADSCGRAIGDGLGSSRSCEDKHDNGYI